MARLKRCSFFLLLFLVVASSASAANFFVNTYNDLVGTDPPNGVCAVLDPATGQTVCSLREAIRQANGLAGADTIYLPPGTYDLTIAGQDEDMDLTGDLDITDDVIILGLQSSRIESQVGRVMHI